MDERYSARLRDIEAAIDRWLPELPESPAKGMGADPLWMGGVFPGVAGIDPALIRALVAPGRDLVSRGGKRWRPLMMALVCEALGGGDSSVPLAPLVELSHNATLIHDDIEDGSDERRGKPAVHLIHGADAAINSGSFMFFLSLACIDSWVAALGLRGGFSRANAAAAKARVYDLWAGFMRKVHLGQAMDIHWHRNVETIPPVDGYLAMCALKTGCLARLAAELGVAAAEIAGGSLGKDAARIGEAAEKLGVGFQILDDVKNIDAGIPGKKRGDDIVEGKKSLPLLLFLHRWPERGGMVFRCLRQARSAGIDAPEVEELIQALAASGVLAEARERAETFVAEARGTFAFCDGAPQGALAGLVDLIG